MVSRQKEIVLCISEPVGKQYVTGSAIILKFLKNLSTNILLPTIKPVKEKKITTRGNNVFLYSIVTYPIQRKNFKKIDNLFPFFIESIGPKGLDIANPDI
jgi:hypothetical protein